MLLWDYIKNHETIIWDWNGTLLNDYQAAWKAECRLFDKIGHSPRLDIEERKKLFTMPVQEYYRRLGFDFTLSNFEELSHQWFEFYEEEIKAVTLFEGTELLLEKVRGAGKRQFILSAGPESHLVEYVNEKNLKKHFHGIYGLKGKTADCKRERGRDLFREHAPDPQKTLIIGDMVHDAEVAEDLGCHVLLVADGHQHYDVLKEKTSFVLKSRY